MYHSKVDANQPQILKQLKQLGISYKPVHQIKGFCDIIVGFKGKNYLFEIKPNDKAKLTSGEQLFHDYWSGQINVVTSIDEILNILNGKV